MNLALLGYGKMGKMVEQIALQKNHSIVVIAETYSNNIDFTNVDVAIDFSIPQSAVYNIKMAIDAGIPIVSGTTGWLEKYDEIVKYCNDKNGTFLYASNFSLGVNLFFELNNRLAEIMKPFDYKPFLVEKHHTEKKDAPSGTAISLANDIVKKLELKNWSLVETKNDVLSINAIREADTTGIHQVIYKSDVDEIEIKHTAYNRKGYALGVLLAAEFLKNKKGVFSMKDVLLLK